MRSDAEIMARMEEVGSEDFFGTQQSDLMDYLPFSLVKPFLKDDVTEEKWKEFEKSRKPESIKAQIADYMTFALGKAHDHRGLSAIRSVDHFKAWTWMLEEDSKIDWSLSGQYGCGVLKQIIDLYQIEVEFGQDFILMAAGEPCSEDCEDGCGRR